MSRRFAWAAAVVLFAASPSAFASPKSDVSAKTKEAMENYDMMDYSAARKSLDGALAAAKKGKLDKDPVTAKVYVDIGITAFADGDTEGAKAAFISAAKIDPKIQIDVAYKSPDLTKLLDEAKSEAKTSGKKTDPEDTSGGDDSIDCSGVKGLQHTIIDTAPAGGPLAIEAMLGADVQASKVVVAYRTAGATDFTTKELSKKGDCKYTGAIPAAAMKGDLVHYYVAALGDNGKPMAAKGSSGSPNIIEIEGKVAGGGAPTPGDDEDPIAGGKKAVPKETATKDEPEGGGDVNGNATITGQKRPKVMFTLAAGTGFGYVSGTTEGGNKVEQCCIGNSYVVLLPEIAYQVNTQLSIGIAGRIGIPVGANVNAKDAASHSTIAPGGLLRVRYAVSKSGDGIRLMGQIGGGVMRNTIHVQTGMPGMDTDIVTQGPLLVGAGVGYIKRLGGNFAFVADFSALLGIAIVDKIGTAKPNTGVGADLSLGIAVGF